MEGQQFRLKNNDPWDTLMIETGKTLAPGVKLFYGPRTMLVDGVESEICEQVWNGDYLLDDNKMVTVCDGVIVEVVDGPAETANDTVGLKAKAKAEKEKYKKRN